MNRRRLGGTILVLGVLVPGLAHAGNGLNPRTPTLWEDVPCMAVHDRSQGAIFHLPYAIPFENTELGDDEPPDSRTHQFFAFCRSRFPQNFLPNWVSQADVDEAIAYDLVMPGVVAPSDILDLNEEWADCFFRINADDERLPITEASADAGVDWDTTGLPAGGYNLYGNTHEPVFNVWWPRPGVVKIHDGDPTAVGPVGAVSTGELTPYRDQSVMAEGCVDALPGTTFSVSYALSATDPEWTEYSADLEIDGDAFAFEFTPPALLHGESGMLRVDFTDPMGRTYTAFQTDHILVIDADNPEGDCEDQGSFIGAPCNESGGQDESSSGGTSVGTASPTGESTAETNADSSGPPLTGGEQSEPKGCACDAARPSSTSALWGTIVVLGLRRRRRRRNQTSVATSRCR
jgi:MYXO-CTERM domain-containing protein